MKCEHCGHTIVEYEHSSTGWTHEDRGSSGGGPWLDDSSWFGIRCPGQLTGATPTLDSQEINEAIASIKRELQ